jgi:hypothetical protein
LCCFFAIDRMTTSRSASAIFFFPGFDTDGGINLQRRWSG